VLFNLAGLEWKRPLEEWEPRGKSHSVVFRSLVDHLVVEYPVPRILYRVFFFHPFRGKGRELCGMFAYVAAGGSLYKYMQSGFFPPVITRKMCHIFTLAPESASFVRSIRYAQAAALGASLQLAKALALSWFGRWFKNDESFWVTVIKWLVENPGIKVEQIDPLVDYIEDMKFRNRNFSMKGRTARSVIRGMNAWHGELARSKDFRGVVFKPSGFNGQTWEHKSKGNKGESSFWTIREILTARELAAEGRAMKHCVVTYAGCIEQGNTSIWSLRQGGMRQLTVQVKHKRKQLVQARGKCNRVPINAEKRILKNWAAQNGLKINVWHF